MNPVYPVEFLSVHHNEAYQNHRPNIAIGLETSVGSLIGSAGDSGVELHATKPK